MDPAHMISLREDNRSSIFVNPSDNEIMIFNFFFIVDKAVLHQGGEFEILEGMFSMME